MTKTTRVRNHQGHAWLSDFLYMRTSVNLKTAVSHPWCIPVLPDTSEMEIRVSFDFVNLVPVLITHLKINASIKQ